jgi:hypothetical protein
LTISVKGRDLFRYILASHRKILDPPGRDALKCVHPAQFTQLRSGEKRVGDDASPVLNAQIADPVHVGKGDGVHQHAVDHAEDRHRCADAEGQRKDGGECEVGRAAEVAEGELEVGEKTFGAQSHPGFVTGLFNAGDVAEFAPGGVFGIFPAHTFGHKGFDFFREVLADLFGEVVVDPPALKNAA